MTSRVPRHQHGPRQFLLILNHIGIVRRRLTDPKSIVPTFRRVFPCRILLALYCLKKDPSTRQIEISWRDGKMENWILLTEEARLHEFTFAFC